MTGHIAFRVFTSCVSGTVACSDAGGHLVGPPLWAISAGAIVVVTIVGVVAALLVRAARRRRESEELGKPTER